MKLLILCALVTVACAAQNDWFNGRWMPVLFYPKLPFGPKCEWTVAIRSDVACSCGDRSDVDVLQFKPERIASWSGTIPRPVVIVNSGDEVTNVVALNCTCGTTLRNQHPIAVHKLNEWAYVAYQNSELVSKQEPNVAEVIVNTIPKLSELQSIVNSVDTLKNREPKYLCEPLTFEDEDST